MRKWDDKDDMVEQASRVASAIVELAKGNIDPPGYAHAHFIEDRLGSFSFGRTSQQTLMKLAAFNSVISYVIWNEFHRLGTATCVEHIHPATAKSVAKKDGLIIPKGVDKKQMTLDWVVSKEPNFPLVLNRNGKPQPYCYDQADAYLIGRAGFIRSCTPKK